MTLLSDALELERRSTGAPIDEAIACLQRAAAICAVVEEPGDDVLGVRARVCRNLAEMLERAGRLPEAVEAYQQAADAFRLLPDSHVEADECARRVVDGVRALWERPSDRLYLLIARHRRIQRELAVRRDTEVQQAECALHIATVLHRRDRFAEAAAAYDEAVGLFAYSADTGLKQATCHHRLAGLYHYELADAGLAAEQYRRAIALYAEFEPLSEGEQMNRVLCEELLASLDSP